MNNEHKNLIKKEIEKHINDIELDRKMAIINTLGIKQLVDYMDASSASKQFFNNFDSDDLMTKYKTELENVSSALGNSNFTCKQKILNFLEYIRLNGMYENISRNKFHMPGLLSGISQSGLNIALLGKGVCASQAKFLRDLLITSGEESRTNEVLFIDEDGLIEDQHLVTYASTSKDEILFIDPTWYNGTIISIEGSLNSASIPEQIKAKLSVLKLTQEEIEQARDTAQQYLIDKYKIKEISKQLGISEASDLDKQIRILSFMEKYLAPTNTELNCRSVVLGNYEIEVGKLLELFYKANNIPYTLQCSDDKYTSVYTTNMDGQDVKLSPRHAYILNRNESPLSRRLHYAINENGENKFLWQFSDEKENQFKTSIKEARKVVESVVIPPIQNCNKNKQFSNSLKVDVKSLDSKQIPFNNTSHPVNLDDSSIEID